MAKSGFYVYNHYTPTFHFCQQVIGIFMEKDETFVPTELRTKATAKLQKEVKQEIKANKNKPQKSIAELIKKKDDADSA